MARFDIAANRRRVKRILLQRRGYQFGQPPATCSLATQSVPGDVACADTCLQMTGRLVQGVYRSINWYRRASKMRAGLPMNVANCRIALLAMGLPYEIRSDLSARELLRIARERGPVFVAEDYWAHPQWKGYRYAGHTMNGSAKDTSGKTHWVGFAEPLERSGSNQHNFKLGHMVLIATSINTPNDDNEGFIFDPNHNSSARPERPAWDRVSVEQLTRMLRSFNRGRSVVAIVPKRRVWK